MQRAFMRRIGFRFSTRVRVGRFLRLRFLMRFFVSQIRCFAGMNFFVLFGRGLLAVGRFLVFFVLLFKDCAAHHSVGSRVSLRLFVFCLDEAGGDYCDVVIAE